MKCDSEKNELHTTSIEQITHQNSVQKSGLWHILFDKSCLRRILFRTKILPAAHLFLKKLVLGVIYFKFTILSTNLLIVRILILSDLENDLYKTATKTFSS